MVAVLGYTKEQITQAVKEMYTVVATEPASPLHFPVGARACRLVGYTDELLRDVPAEALESFAGVGCPFRADVVEKGDVVLDIGAGAGVDSFVASRLTGPEGKVFALDMTPAMRAKLARLIVQTGRRNIEVIEGQAERIPLPTASVDVVTSNGVLNLVPDKRRAIAEIFRVLKPGGRVQIADIVIHRPITPDCLGDPKLWAECVVGATVDDDYLDMFRDAGFEDVEVLRGYDYFEFSPSAETREIAESFGARAIEIRMRGGRPVPMAGRLLRRADPRRLLRQVQRRGLWGMVALVAAILACYGTLLAVASMAALGVPILVDEAVWAAAIVIPALLAAAAVTAGLRKHGGLGAAVTAVLGAGVVVYVMTVRYDQLVELAGFALLAAGVLWDQRLRRRGPRASGAAGPSAG